ncbi:putative 104,1 kDa protein in hypE 3'region [Planktothrix tepida]|uniref:protein-glutamate O-methyltransferase n=1 Tax=Planktothrix tepida PCC 9214 TaxID=671072 RepID=A0A1J1LS67_9CYAN|nr:CheR family methyltransferase [Planktothrix tepida]CAD5962965.1 putative 104,1 kDa protein in hypE 3'region [Planktothrix tepida]CUR34858.1 MCP methyltransferase, CheR-type with PAS/PAC sensor [Planktothrix tepida PCC 9214]
MTNSSKNIEFEALLDYVKRSRGFDFAGYKRSSLMRRVNKRMQTINIEGYSNYLDYLEVHPEEFNFLFTTILINVTSFWRDRTAWDYVRDEIIPRILATKEPHETIRIWSAGCASGEEAYTISMMVAEAIGIEQFRERVKIYATDIDEEALNQARQAIYLQKDLNGLSPEQIEQFFEKIDTRYTFRKDLRRCVIFGRHDLLQDAPISKVDLLVCRNTLMYFNAEAQSRILARFHFALRDGGFLFLGKAEMLLTHANTFTPTDLKCRVFAKVPKLNLRDRLLIMAQTGNEEAVNHLSSHVRLRELAFDSGPCARIIIDTNGLLALANERARFLFSLTTRDVGRPLQDLEISYRPIELRSCMEQAYSEKRPVNIRDIEWQMASGDIIFIDVQVCPLLDANNQTLGISINFIDMTRYKNLQEDLEHSNQELEMAYEELQSTNEELETTNEELQSSNEELETTNEELQSTNEELETMNEELQSTNEELQTVNDELQRRGEELNQANAFLQSILTSLKGGVVVLNRDLQVQIWNYKSEDLWGLRHEEAIKQNFLNLDIGLPVDKLRQPIRICLSGEPNQSSKIIVNAINRRGKSIQCQVNCSPLMGSQGQIQGVILLMEELEEANS